MSLAQEAGPTELEVQILGQLLGNLSSFVLVLLGYLTFLLWRDYISTILCAFIVSQALHKQRERLVQGVRSLREPSAPPLLHATGAALLRSLWSAPPLLSLALLLLVFLLADYTSWGTVLTALGSVLVLVALPLWLLDRRARASVMMEPLPATINSGLACARGLDCFCLWTEVQRSSRTLSSSCSALSLYIHTHTLSTNSQHPRHTQVLACAGMLSDEVLVTLGLAALVAGALDCNTIILLTSILLLLYYYTTILITSAILLLFIYYYRAGHLSSLLSLSSISHPPFYSS